MINYVEVFTGNIWIFTDIKAVIRANESNSLSSATILECKYETNNFSPGHCYIADGLRNLPGKVLFWTQLVWRMRNFFWLLRLKYAYELLRLIKQYGISYW